MMSNIYKVILTGCLLMLPLACASVTPHQNFVMLMQFAIGKSVDDPTVSDRRQPARLIDRKTLSNGNIEEAYRFRGACRYFYEVNPTTRMIEDWRFEGDERDCIINP
jgi:hypothetical protein